MEGHLLLTALRKYRLEIKYLTYAIIAFVVLLYLTRTDAFEGIQGKLQDTLEWVANEEGLIGGSIGLFLIALIANTSLLVQVPYTIPLMNIAIVSTSIGKLLILSIATGIGAGLGEINSYLIARGLSAPIQSPEDSKLYRWIKHSIQEHPRAIPVFIFIASASVLPDDLVVWPLAIAKYPVRKILTPMLVGKVIHNFLFAMIAYYGVELIDADEAVVRIDLTIGILIIFVLYIMYQIEKVRTARLHEITPEA